MAFPLRQTGGPVSTPDLDDIARDIARLIADAAADHSGAALQRLIASQGWRQTWIDLRDLGVYIRKRALRNMGLPNHDPRQGGVSANQTIQHAAFALGLGTWAAPEALALQTQQEFPARKDFIFCWVQYYPQYRLPQLCVRKDAMGPSCWFQAACLLGYYSYHFGMFSGDVPAGPVLAPLDIYNVSMMHAFAKGLLCLAERCPDEYACRCNETLRGIHAPVPPQFQPTGELNANHLRREVARQSGIPYVPPRSSAPPSRPLSQDSHRPWHVVPGVDPDELDEGDWDDDPPTTPVGPRSRR